MKNFEKIDVQGRRGKGHWHDKKIAARRYQRHKGKQDCDFPMPRTPKFRGCMS